MKEEDLFDLTLKVVRARGAGKIKGIQPHESQGERTISIDYDEQQARISIIIHQNDYIQIRCSFTFTSFVQTFEYVFDDKMTNEQKEKILATLIFDAQQNGNGTNEEIIRFEMYFENARILSDYFFTNEIPETQVKILKRLFENTPSDYKRDIWDINEITKTK